LIAYFDTSAVVPLLVEEPGTPQCAEQWSVADRVVSVRLVKVEARAALAQAARQDRLTSRQLRATVDALDDLVAQLDLIDVDEDLIDGAAELAETHSLRAYDAIHLAAALAVGDDDLVLVAGDRALLTAGSAVGLGIAVVG
jgi:predicted nucleic acid-binding protein